MYLYSLFSSFDKDYKVNDENIHAHIDICHETDVLF